MTDKNPEQVGRVWNAYQRMRVLLSSQIGRALAQEADLSEAEFDILQVLAGAKDHTLRALALRCGLDWEKSRLSHQIGRMEKRGLLRREACEEDGRSALILLTRQGLEAFERGALVHKRLVDAHFGDLLSRNQLDVLEQIAEKVVSRIERDNPAIQHELVEAGA